MRRSALTFLALLLALAAVLITPRLLHNVPVGALPAGEPPAANAPGPASPARPEIGFRSSERLAAHWRKHGGEFGAVTMAGYLRLAQALRDGPAVPYAVAGRGATGRVIEAVRADGVVTRFDRVHGAFLAFDADGTIRTFFKPHDGEAYFRRQLERVGGEP